VIELHLLIVTRDFEHQETLLNSRDFQALAACMTGVDGLGFYNGGTAAGASQTHKHLQLVPLPLSSDGPAVPIEPLLAGARTDAKPDQAPGLPFRHAFLRLDPALFTRPAQAGEELFAQYCSLCHAVGLGSALVDSRLQQSAPYNLLLTRDWMLLVPRTCEHADSISVNALGFAGSLFVKDQAQMGLIRQRGPMAVLQAVTHPA
jgi:ATP adenylyltransferase